jgi:Kef-type K+ transport system membrane component KefB
MKRLKGVLFYVVTLVVFVGIIVAVLYAGRAQESASVTAGAPVVQSAWAHFRATYHANFTHPLAILLLQITTIILAARLFGALCRMINQPTVIGEIAAGIFLGPSFVGQFFPEFSGFLFPATSLSNLQFLSQIGLILFMFVVGMELDLSVLKKKAKDAVIISHASIVFPFTLGVLFAYQIYGEYAPEGINFLSFALFCGVAMSITAFPVLARIVQEKGLMKTRLGALAITCAAADDITAWCILAAVIAIVKAGSFMTSVFIIVLAALYVLVMLKLVRPFLRNLGDKYANREGLSKPVVAIFFLTLIISSYVTELIGIHALFGAFMAGVIMPSNVRFRSLFIEKVEDVALVLLLPLFFVFTGLRTQIGLLNSGEQWMTCLLVILVAITGKFVGSMVAAKFVGQSWRDSLVIGALMNTRGLVELVVLNIGYDLGVLSPEIFAMLVIMAVLTTVMTSPALSLINRIFPEQVEVGTLTPGDAKFNVLVSFGSPEKGVSLLRVANALVRNHSDSATITAMHLSPSTDINQYNFLEYEKESFKPIKHEAKKLDQPLNLFFKPSRDIEQEISQTANDGNFNLLMIGVGKSVFEGTFLGNVIGYGGRFFNPRRIADAVSGRQSLFRRDLFDQKVTTVLRATKVPVAILLDRKPGTIQHVIVALSGAGDLQSLNYAGMLLANGAQVSVVFLNETGNESPVFQTQLDALRGDFPVTFKIEASRKPDKSYLKEFDLMLLSLETWRSVVTERPKWMGHVPSVMIVRG